MFSLNNEAVQSYIAYSSLLALKLLFLTMYTTSKRIPRGVFSNPEDTAFGGKVKYDDPVVERVRRAHLNDIENIPAFWLLGALYLTTGPVVAWARLLFRLYAAGRFLHTVVYAITPLPQPTRFIAFFIPYIVMWYMGIQTVLFYISAL